MHLIQQWMEEGEQGGSCKVWVEWEVWVVWAEDLWEAWVDLWEVWEDLWEEWEAKWEVWEDHEEWVMEE